MSHVVIFALLMPLQQVINTQHIYIIVQEQLQLTIHLDRVVSSCLEPGRRACLFRIPCYSHSVVMTDILAGNEKHVMTVASRNTPAV